MPAPQPQTPDHFPREWADAHDAWIALQPILPKEWDRAQRERVEPDFLNMLERLMKPGTDMQFRLLVEIVSLRAEISALKARQR